MTFTLLTEVLKYFTIEYSHLGEATTPVFLIRTR